MVARTFQGVVAEACADELVKISAVWDKTVRRLIDKGQHAEAGVILDKMYRLEGIRPPLRGSAERLTGGTDGPVGAGEVLINLLRKYKGIKLPGVAPKGSPEWRAAMKDIKEGRMVGLESGMSRSQAKSIQQFGPSSSIVGGESGKSSARDLWEQQVQQMARKAEDAAEAMVDAGKLPLREGGRARARIHRKADSGIWTHPAGTPRTKEYAYRAGRWEKDTPAIMSFQLPESLAGLRPHSEHTVPHKMFQEWARKIQVKAP